MGCAASHGKPVDVRYVENDRVVGNSTKEVQLAPIPASVTGDAKTAREDDLEKQSLANDGAMFPVLMFNGSLHIAPTDRTRLLRLSVRLSSGERTICPSEDGLAFDDNGAFKVSAKKQKNVSYFEADDRENPSESHPSVDLIKQSAIILQYERRLLRCDAMTMGFCLTVTDVDDGSCVELQSTLNLLEPDPVTSNCDEDGQVPSTALGRNVRRAKVEFTSFFGAKVVAALEFQYEILFAALGGGAIARLAMSPLAAQFPLVYEIMSEVVTLADEAALAPESVPTVESELQSILLVAATLTSESKITFLRNQLKGVELADKYEKSCKVILRYVDRSNSHEALLQRIETSKATIVNVFSHFFDTIMSAKDGTIAASMDVADFIAKYKKSTGEIASQGSDRGGSMSSLAALLCDVKGLVEPLIRAAPFGMLVVECIGVLFKLIVCRSDMAELCDKIAARLSIFLRVLQQPDVQCLLRDDPATLDACVGVYVAIDDCTECIKRFHDRNIVAQLLSASSQLTALQSCYNSLSEQFSAMHDVTSLRAMAANKRSQLDVDAKLEQLLLLQSNVMMNIDIGNAALLSKLNQRMEGLQGQWLEETIKGSPTSFSHLSERNASEWNDPMINNAICICAKECIGDEGPPRGEPQHVSEQLRSAAFAAIDAVGDKATNAAELSHFCGKVISEFRSSGPLRQASSAANSEAKLLEVVAKAENSLLAAYRESAEEILHQQAKAQHTSRAEFRKLRRAMTDKMDAIASSQKSMVEKLGQMHRDVLGEIGNVRQDIKELKGAVIEPMKLIEAHIRQYTDYTALNKPREIAEKDLSFGHVLHSGPTSEIVEATLQNRKVVVKKYRDPTAVANDEATTLFALHHERIVELLGVVRSASLHDGSSGRHDMVVLERLGSDLKSLMQQGQVSKMVTREQRLQFTFDFLAALNFLHSQSPPLVHRCVELSNVVLTGDSRAVKLVDFKQSKPLKSLSTDSAVPIASSTLATGTAPEVATGQLSYSVASDTYSAGIALYELWSGKLAFMGKHGKLLLAALQEGMDPFSPSDFAALPLVIQAMLQSLTDANVSRRISIASILRLNERFGLALLEAKESEWRDYFPFWRVHEEECMSLCTENIPRFSKALLRKYFVEKEIAEGIVSFIVAKGYTAKQYLRADFCWKAFPPEVRKDFDALHLDSFVELHGFDSKYHAAQEVKTNGYSSGDTSNKQGVESEQQLPLNRRGSGQRANCPVQEDDVHCDDMSIDGSKAAASNKMSLQVVVKSIVAENRWRALLSRSEEAKFSGDSEAFWLALADSADMRANGYASHAGEVVTRKECFRRALQKSALKSATAWIGLASCLHSSWESVAVSNVPFSRKECIVKALALNPSAAEPWTLLVSILGENETVVVNGKEYTRRRCCEQSVLLNRNSSEAWATLALFVGGKESLRLEDGTTVTKKDCIVNAINNDFHNGHLWQQLAVSLGPDELAVIQDHHYTASDLLKRSVECDPQVGASWLYLGLRLPLGTTVNIDNKDFNKKMCFAEAANRGCHEAFSFLGYAMESTNESYVIQGKEMTRVEVLCRGIEIDDSVFCLWNDLGVTMIYRKLYPPATVNIGGVPYTMTQVFLSSIERDPLFGKHWNGLGISLGDGESVVVLQQRYTKQQCYLKALSILPDYHFAWNWLGMTLKNSNDTILVNDEVVTKRNCFLKALELCPTYAYAWWNIAMDVTNGESVVIRGKSYSYRDLVQKGLSLYPKDKDMLEKAAALHIS